MKRRILFLIMSTFLVACSVENEELNLQEDLPKDGLTLNAGFTEVDNSEPCNPSIFVELCSNEITNPTLQGFRAYFRAQILLHTDLPMGGSFDPSMAELVEQYHQEGQTGTFTSYYSVETEDCGMVTSEVNVDVIDCNPSEEPCAEDIFVEVCSDQVQDPDPTEFETYYLAQVQIYTDLPSDGTFNPTMEELYSEFNQSGGLGTFTTNYTVDTEECGSTTIEVTAQVNDCSQPVCAEDIFVEVCSDQVQDPDPAEFETYYLAQVQIYTDLPLDGNFNPTMEELYSEFNQSGGIGTFTTNYTVNTEECGSTTIEVTAQVSDCSQPVCAEDIFVEVCSDQVQDPDPNEFESYYRAQVQLYSDLPLDGTFDPNMEELYSEFNQSGGIGTFTTDYTVQTEECGEVSIEVAAQVTSCN